MYGGLTNFHRTLFISVQVVRLPEFLFTTVENGWFRRTSVWCGSGYDSWESLRFGSGTVRTQQQLSNRTSTAPMPNLCRLHIADTKLYYFRQSEDTRSPQVDFLMFACSWRKSSHTMLQRSRRAFLFRAQVFPLLRVYNRSPQPFGAFRGRSLLSFVLIFAVYTRVALAYHYLSHCIKQKRYY